MEKNRNPYYKRRKKLQEDYSVYSPSLSLAAHKKYANNKLLTEKNNEVDEIFRNIRN